MPKLTEGERKVRLEGWYWYFSPGSPMLFRRNNKIWDAKWLIYNQKNTYEITKVNAEHGRGVSVGLASNASLETPVELLIKCKVRCRRKKRNTRTCWTNQFSWCRWMYKMLTAWVSHGVNGYLFIFIYWLTWHKSIVSLILDCFYREM